RPRDPPGLLDQVISLPQRRPSTWIPLVRPLISEQVARLDFGEAEERREGTRIAIDPARLWHKLDELLALLSARYPLRSAEWLSPRVTLRGRPHVSNEGRIRLGDRVRLVSTLARLELVTLEDG